MTWAAALAPVFSTLLVGSVDAREHADLSHNASPECYEGCH